MWNSALYAAEMLETNIQHAVTRLLRATNAHKFRVVLSRKSTFVWGEGGNFLPLQVLSYRYNFQLWIYEPLETTAACRGVCKRRDHCLRNINPKKQNPSLTNNALTLTTMAHCIVLTYDFVHLKIPWTL